MGATATGKTSLAIALAEAFNGEIISMDSRQVYRRLDIGTAKPDAEELARVPHHLIDVLDPHESYSAGRHLQSVIDSAVDIERRGKRVFLVGGTGLFFRVFFDGLIDVKIPAAQQQVIRTELEAHDNAQLHALLTASDPVRAAELSRNDRVRMIRALELFRYSGCTYGELLETQHNPVAWCGLSLVLTMPRDVLRDRIAARTRDLFDAGWRDEVAALLAAGVQLTDPAMNSLGYRTIAEGDGEKAQVEAVIEKTRQYAKRQETFFRSVSGARWIDMADTGAAQEARRQVGAHFAL